MCVIPVRVSQSTIETKIKPTEVMLENGLMTLDHLSCTYSIANKQYERISLIYTISFVFEIFHSFPLCVINEWFGGNRRFIHSHFAVKQSNRQNVDAFSSFFSSFFLVPKCRKCRVNITTYIKILFPFYVFIRPMQNAHTCR